MPADATDIDVHAVPLSIDDGDRSALQGDWPQAIRIWQQHLDGVDGASAAQRIRWFIEQESEHRGFAFSRANPSGNRFVLLLFALGFGLIGTACVFIGENQTGIPRNVLAGCAWTLYIAAATLVIVYAYRAGQPPARPIPSLSPDELRQAIRLADALHAGQSTPHADTELRR